MKASTTQLTIEIDTQMAPRHAGARLRGPALALRGPGRGDAPLACVPAGQRYPSAAIAAGVPHAQLFGLLVHYLGQHEDDQRFLGEARRVGKRYGAESRQAGASLYDAVGAFLPIRGAFSQLAMPMPGVAQPDDLAELVSLLARINRFVDSALLGVIAGFEER